MPAISACSASVRRQRELASQQIFGRARLALANQSLRQHPFSRPVSPCFPGGPAQPFGKLIVERGERPAGCRNQQPGLGQRSGL